ncbi:MAG: riboflavin synthase [Bacteroidetes bacterium]|nr:riboflavin synthase [Bacteroidota bacterium]
MFTGIIESLGKVQDRQLIGSNIDFWIESNLVVELKIDQSLAHNGVCLTVVELEATRYRVTAIAETLNKTSLATWQLGQAINLERALRMGDRLDGHFVQGHVDTTTQCLVREEKQGSWLFQFALPEAFSALVVEKGSVCIDGVSLTVFNVGRDSFQVAIIPYTFAHTSFSTIVAGTTVNLEFDILGKYFLRHQSLHLDNSQAST